MYNEEDHKAVYFLKALVQILVTSAHIEYFSGSDKCSNKSFLSVIEKRRYSVCCTLLF